MDQAREQTEVVAARPQGPHLQAAPEAARAAVPLRLTLEPSGLIVEVTQADTLVGRHHEANLRLPLPDVSRQHCRLIYEERAWRVRDLNSMNGVYVNEVRVQEAVLQDHDTLRIGGFGFRVDLHSCETTLPLAGGEPERIFRDIAEALSAPPPDR